MDLQEIIIVIVVALIVYFLKTKLSSMNSKSEKENARPDNISLPITEIENDKLIIVEDISSDEIDRVLTDFCNMYNNEKWQVLTRRHKINESKFALLFPFDIEFKIYCYLINYIHYPIDFDKQFVATAWATTKKGQTWIDDKLEEKEVMIFIPEVDNDFDSVYITTSENIGYKLSFSLRNKKQRLDFPGKQFIAPKVELRELVNGDYLDFK